MPLNHKLITLNASRHTHLSEHIHNRLRPIALLIRQTAHTCNAARTLTERSQHRNDREKIRTIRRIHSKSLKRSTLNCDIAPIALKLRKTRTRIHEDIHDRKIRLKRSSIQALHLKFAEESTCHKEIRSRTPITLKVDICSLIFLTTLHLEHNLSTERPITARLYEIPTAEHIITHLDTELLQHLNGNEHIWNTLRLTHNQRSVLL